MSLDITVLRLLKYRDRYERLARNVPPKALDTNTRIILDDFGQFFREFPTCSKIPAQEFMLWFKGFRHKGLKDEATAVFDLVLKEAQKDVDVTLEAGLMARLVAADTAVRVAELIEQWNAGDEVDLYLALRKHVEDFEMQVDRKVKSPQVLDRIEDLLKAEENDVGFHWRLPCLNRHIKPLVAGDFVVVAARPDKGKTTFSAAELTHMAAQVDTLYPDERRSILWFNNEGPGRRIVTRCFQAALNATVEELVVKSNRGSIRDEYAAALGGRGGTLRIFDIHDMWNHEVEDLIKTHKPAGILFDMVDNIKFGGDTNNNGQRTDQLLEAMYQWARLIGVKHDCWTMANSQISAGGDGQQWPTLPQLKDSQTGKQGAADVIITIGSLNDPNFANSRFIGTTKNKKVRTKMSANPMCEVTFDGDRARYNEIQQ